MINLLPAMYSWHNALLSQLFVTLSSPDHPCASAALLPLAHFVPPSHGIMFVVGACNVLTPVVPVIDLCGAMAMLPISTLSMFIFIVIDSLINEFPTSTRDANIVYKLRHINRLHIPKLHTVV